MSNMSKRMKVLFTTSVLLNVIFLGVFGGYVVKRWMHHPWHDVKAELSPESQHIVAKTMQDAFRDMRPAMQESRKAKKKLMEIVKAEEFDEAAFDKLSKTLTDNHMDLMERRIAVTKELASQLSQEDRNRLAGLFAKGFSSGKRQHRRPHRDDGEKDSGFMSKWSGKKGPRAFLKDVQHDPDVPAMEDEISPPEMPDDMPPMPKARPAQ